MLKIVKATLHASRNQSTSHDRASADMTVCGTEDKTSKMPYKKVNVHILRPWVENLLAPKPRPPASTDNQGTEPAEPGAWLSMCSAPACPKASSKQLNGQHELLIALLDNIHSAQAVTQKSSSCPRIPPQIDIPHDLLESQTPSMRIRILTRLLGQGYCLDNTTGEHYIFRQKAGET